MWCVYIHIYFFIQLQQITTYTLVNWLNYRKSPFWIGKSTINGVCSIAMLNYQRVKKMQLQIAGSHEVMLVRQAWLGNDRLSPEISDNVPWNSFQFSMLQIFHISTIHKTPWWSPGKIDTISVVDLPRKIIGIRAAGALSLSHWCVLNVGNGWGLLGWLSWYQ